MKNALIIGLLVLILFSCLEEESPVTIKTIDLDTLENPNVPDTSSTQIPEIQWPSGATIDAASGSAQDIRTALQSATPGDNIRIPAGTFMIDESIYLEAGVNIYGAGCEATILQTDGVLENPIFVVDGSNGLPVAISNMKLIGGDRQADSDLMDDGINLRNGCQDFRITGMEFENFGQAAIDIFGNSRGVVDNCRFINIYRPAIGTFGYGVSVYGDGEAGWDRPFIPGDHNAVFVEDCYFIGNRHAIASNNGSRYVFRHNLVEDNGQDNGIPGDNDPGLVQAIDAHGQGYGSLYGSRSYEIYSNTVNNINTTCWVAIYIRGGDGVIFDNNFYGNFNHYNPIMLTKEGGGDTYPADFQIRELYVWENYYDEVLTVPTSWSGNFVEENRDYFNYERPEYTPFTYPHPLRD